MTTIPGTERPARAGWADPALPDAEGALHPGGTCLTGRAVTLAGVRAGAAAVDVGAGGGATVAYLCHRFGLRCVGVEPDPVLARRARARGAAVVRGTAEALPFGDATVDLVLAECVLSVLDDPAVALAQAARVLRPGGTLVITDLYARGVQDVAARRRLPPGLCLRGVRGRATVLGAVRAAGLLPVRWEDHTAALRRAAVRLAWAGVAPDALWCTAPADGPDAHPTAHPAAHPAAHQAAVRDAVRAVSPGYHLIVARTPGGVPWTT